MTLCCFFTSCDKGDIQSPGQENPAVTSETDNNGSAPNTNVNNNDPLSFRACSGCTGCCCVLQVTAPANATVPIYICGANIEGGSGDTCSFGNSPCASIASGTGGAANLVVGSSPDDTKEFCSGSPGQAYRITNNYSETVTFSLDCGGGATSFDIPAGRSAYITKGSSCEIDPDPPCIFVQ